MKKLLSFFLLIGSFNLLSHEFNPAHLIINQSDNNQTSYDATWMYPVKNIGKRADVIFPDICTPIAVSYTHLRGPRDQRGSRMPSSA